MYGPSGTGKHLCIPLQLCGSFWRQLWPRWVVRLAHHPWPVDNTVNGTLHSTAVSISHYVGYVPLFATAWITRVAICIRSIEDRSRLRLTKYGREPGPGSSCNSSSRMFKSKRCLVNMRSSKVVHLSISQPKSLSFPLVVIELDCGQK